MEIMEYPFPETPGEREAILSEVQEKIRSLDQIHPDLREALLGRANEFVQSKIVHASGAKFYGGQLGWTSYVIRNDHLDTVALLSPAANAVATYVAATGGSPIPLAVSLLFSLAAVAKKLRAKSSTLHSDDYKVLMALKAVGSATPADIAAVLNDGRRHEIYDPIIWSSEQVLERIRGLKTVRLGDGSVESFVVELPEGKWSVNGV